MSFRELHKRWEFDLKSSPERLWPFIADTNRFNRDTGVPEIEVDAAHKPLRNARRKVRLSLYGVPVEWEEQPFEWVKPFRFGIERIYHKGPLARLRVLAELTPNTSGGTHLVYQLWSTPRNLPGAVAISLQIKLIVARRFREAIQKYDTAASEGLAIETSEPNTSQSLFDLARLTSLHQKLAADLEQAQLPAEKRAVADRLADFLEHADDLAVTRIRAYKLADDWNQPRRDVLEICLRATRVGLLDFQWDLLCPLCRGPQESGQSLRDINAHVHCEACKIDFTVDFDRYVELTFRPNPAVRRVAVTSFCVGSPEFTPHVVVQQLLPPGERRSLNLPLEIGSYRLRALELPGSQDVTVSSGGATSVQVAVAQNGWRHDPLQVAERFTLDLQNETGAEQLLILERMAWNDQATTAAEVTALQMFRDLFAAEALRPGEQISVGTLTVLFTDLRDSTKLYREIGDATAFGRVMNHFDVLKKAIAEHDGALVKTIGDAVMAVFRRASDGLVAMLEAQRVLAQPPEGTMPLQLKAGLHTGPCIAVTLNDRLDYFGSTVNLAARLEGLSTGSDVIISRSVYEDTKVRELLEAQRLAASEFDMSLKGFENERFELWRISERPRKDTEDTDN
ncbi:MAG TPA: adenylate/guanylate cyclase domain-containing protein [Pyrinomonadaceae bacterium]|nr:adenylate/guanylate cyclase domain-containing protein [Pyrinomonadaceae bacterium]